MIIEEFVVDYYPSIKFNKKRHQSWFMRKLVGLSMRIMNRYDARRDKKVCGCSLVKYVPSLYRKSKGATGSHSSRYLFLKQAFQGLQFTPEDKVIDIGCGKGRVLAYLLEQGYEGELRGVELNEEVAGYAKKWTEKYPNVIVDSCDAFEIDYNAYTVLIMARPFELPVMARFIKKLEAELTHPVTILSWYDQLVGDRMDHRPGWTLHKREWIFRSHGFYLEKNPQRCSVWTLDSSKI